MYPRYFVRGIMGVLEHRLEKSRPWGRWRLEEEVGNARDVVGDTTRDPGGASDVEGG
jgi:hypothetical protein